MLLEEDHEMWLKESESQLLEEGPRRIAQSGFGFNGKANFESRNCFSNSLSIQHLRQCLEHSRSCRMSKSWLERAPLVASPLEVTLTPSSHTGNVDQLTFPVSDMIMQSVSCLGFKLSYPYHSTNTYSPEAAPTQLNPASSSSFLSVLPGPAALAFPGHLLEDPGCK